MAALSRPWDDPGKGALSASTAAKQEREPKHIGDRWISGPSMPASSRPEALLSMQGKHLSYDISAQRDNDL
jgi:hypothetical protein